MKYDPDKHHRQSIRLKGYDYSSPGAYFITICTHQRDCLFGAIVDGEMRLNEFGMMGRSHWMRLPRHHKHVELDAFVVMPNHVHGILVLTDPDVGAGFDVNKLVCTDNGLAKPAPTDDLDTGSAKSVLTDARVGAGFDVNTPVCNNNGLAKPAPTGLTPPTDRHGVPEIIRGFKTFSARCINRRRRVAGIPVWQRNYYEHVIRSEEFLCSIRQYIQHNPLAWHEDQSHPDVPSKW